MRRKELKELAIRRKAEKDIEEQEYKEYITLKWD